MVVVIPDPEAAYRAVQTRDARFDGQFVTAVRTTRIYCRPACPARTPLRRNVDFFPTPAAAQAAGYRACRRCLPDAAPGSPEWNLRADTVGAAMRLIADGVVDREGIPGLAARVGYTPRHLGRLLAAEVGASPLALARARRAHTARVLLTTTAMPMADVAFAAGFASVRQFNDTVREVFAVEPGRLRAQRRAAAGAPAPAGTLSLRLPVRWPFAAAPLLDFLAARAVPGVEHVDGPTYRRVLRLPHGLGVARLDLPVSAGQPVLASLTLQHLSDLVPAVDRCRRLLDLDADPVHVDAALSADPALAASVAQRPGLRVPGAVDGPEMLVRALLGQQVSVTAARTALGRLARHAGTPLPPELAQAAGPALTHAFPGPDELAALEPADIPGPQRRALAVIRAAQDEAAGDLVLDAGRRPGDLTAQLAARPGIGPWTAGYVTMRVLGDPDVLLPGDVGLRQGAAALGLPPDDAALAVRAAAWRPFRSYAGAHLWRAAAAMAATRRRRDVPRAS
ncbi:DNA-3-methyladenine glycosylase [Nakamurella endophytica]|uniref:DNA-3-methyladenine glycosylase II n=1 Tax=Nakamurella endophytica TaxID=1748367 RepID=A0A917SMJ9_9ACTN|nr:DNA-3-methyladenine glycosylase [Nakamurella endophytica]